MMKRLLSWYFFPGFLIFVFLVIFTLYSLQTEKRVPEILSIAPSIGKAGDVLVIRGHAFRTDDLGSWISIGGRRIARSNLLEWSDTRISVRVPYTVYTGLVTVETPGGIARGPLFMNKDQMPLIEGAFPRNQYANIVSVHPSKVAPGSELRIMGQRFGYSAFEHSILIGSKRLNPQNILWWSDNEIRIITPYVQDQAQLRIVGPNLQSNEVVLDFELASSLIQKLGTIKYELVLGYDLGEVEYSDPSLWGSIQLNSPILPAGLGVESKFERFDGEFTRISSATRSNDVYILERPVTEKNYELRLKWSLSLDILSVDLKTKNPVRITVPESIRYFLKSSPLVPLEDSELQKMAASQLKAEPNYVKRAEKLYDFVIQHLHPDAQKGLSFAPEVLKDRSAQSFGYANALIALMRMTGIPARMVEGLYVHDQQGRHDVHFWVEWFLPGTGWLLADPWLADLTPTNVPSFGSQDGRHIALVIEDPRQDDTQLHERSIRVYNQLVLMNYHGSCIGGVESFGIVMYAPEVRPITSMNFLNSQANAKAGIDRDSTFL